MQKEVVTGKVPSLQKQLQEEERNYKDALRKDVPFFLLKEIRLKIKQLKTELEKSGNSG
jgi:hypothetical protein